MLKLQIFGTVSLVILLSIEVILAYFYLIDSGCDLVESFQDHSSGFLDGVWWFLNFATLPFILKIILFSFYLGSRTIGMELVVLSVTSTMTGSILKILIAYPRPFWYSEEIEGKSCEFDFGDPSTHMILCFTILSYSIWRFKKPAYLYGLVCLFLGLVFFERTYGGLHTYSQLLLGLLIGMYLLLIFIEYNSELNSYVKGLKQKPFSLPLVITAFVSLAFPLLLVFVRDPWWDNDWNDNVEEDCDDFNSDVALEAQFLDCLYILYLIGAVFGFHLFRKAKINVKKTVFWKKALVIAACFLTHFVCKVLETLSTGVFAVDVFIVALLCLCEGFLCFGGICLPFGCLREAKNEEKEQFLEANDENKNS